jgi:hypothetical protein
MLQVCDSIVLKALMCLELFCSSLRLLLLISETFLCGRLFLQAAAGEKADFYEVRLISSDLAATST